jgi:hypothetical protein
LLEEKDYSLAWLYRGADPELGEARAKELVDDLTQYTANFGVQVLEGKKVVEIRSAEMRCISKAMDAGVDPTGGTIAVVRVRAPGNPAHGTEMPPCSTCREVMGQLGISPSR